jgi:hypothetical protein
MIKELIEPQQIYKGVPGTFSRLKLAAQWAAFVVFGSPNVIIYAPSARSPSASSWWS